MKFMFVINLNLIILAFILSIIIKDNSVLTIAINLIS